MFITKNLTIVRRQNGTIAFNFHDFCDSIAAGSDLGIELDKIATACLRIPSPERERAVQDMLSRGEIDTSAHSILAKLSEELVGTANPVTVPATPLTPEQEAEKAKKMMVHGIGRLIDFFSEFQFQPNFRFLNSLSHALLVSEQEATNYVLHYFELTDSSYTNDVEEKMKSPEFGEILRLLSQVEPTHTVNKRFKLYYGSQGTGKTTIAQQESENRCVVCNSSMLPADLMEDFVFEEGKAAFQKSMLWNCMEAGEILVLDEINLLPFDSLRFLQGILDGKTEFQYKGLTVHIKDGFQIIGTMNLTVNGMTYGLPEPLVDRCAQMKKFTLSPSQLASAIL